MDMKVGEYIRTQLGDIGKIESVNMFNANLYRTNKGTYSKEEITKHSFNIIDLIEIGDYVNGHLVVAKNDNKIATEIAGLNGAILHWYKEKGIKSILTKEQFKAMEYEV